MRSMEIYIKNEEVTIATGPVRPTYSTLLGRWDIVPWNLLPQACYTVSILPEENREALEIAQKVAQKTGVNLKVRDVNYLEGKILAYLRGVRKTPTVIIGNKKIEKITEEVLLSYLLSLEPKQSSNSS